MNQFYLILITLSIFTIVSSQVIDLNALKNFESTSSAASTSSSLQFQDKTLLSVESQATSVSNNGFSATSIAQGLANANDYGIATNAIARTIGDPFSLVKEQDYAYNLHTLYADDNVFNETNYSANSYSAMDFEGMLVSYRTAMSETITSTDYQNGVMHDAEYQYAKLTTGTNNLGALETQNTRDIVVEFDISNVKVLVERILTNEDKVMVVSAANSLLTSLIKQDREYLQMLYKGKCSCKQLKDFLVGLLTDSA